ncbi:MAG: HlyD family efflux transporter periplasmic adaptor subunit [Kofleriaceae bacterium]
MKRAIPLVMLLVIGGVYFAYKRWLAHRPFEWAGTVEVRAVTVGSRTGGRVKQVLVREGDRVTANAPLVILEPGDLDAQRAIAQALLEQAQAALDKLTKGARPEEILQAKARADQAQAAFAESRRGSRVEEIAAAEARLAQAQATVDKAQLDAERSRKLLAVNAIPAAEAELADTLLKTTAAQRDAQRKVVEQLKAGTRVEEKQQAAARVAEADAAAKLVIAGARVEDLRAAQAQVAAAKARVDQLDVMLRELTVRAPATMRIESLDLRPGDLVAPNAPVATLLEDDQLYVRIYVPETQLGHVHVGDAVPITVDSYDRSFGGKIEHIDARGEYSPRNLQTADQRADQVFAVRVGVVDGRNELRAGMAATVEVAR